MIKIPLKEYQANVVLLCVLSGRFDHYIDIEHELKIRVRIHVVVYTYLVSLLRTLITPLITFIDVR